MAASACWTCATAFLSVALPAASASALVSKAQMLSRAVLHAPQHTAIQGGSLPDGAHSAGPSTAAQTLLALDRNHDGEVDPKEVADFARSQGLNVDTVTRDFMDIDHSGDGSLDLLEINMALNGSADSSATVARPKDRLRLRSFASQEEARPSAEAPPSTSSSVSPMDDLSKRIRSLRKTLPNKVPPEEYDDPNSMAAALVQEEASETRAQLLEEMASELRANASILAKTTAQRAVKAGASAARNQAAQMIRELEQLETGAQKAEVTAAALRAKAKTELEQADDIMAAADAALLATDKSQLAPLTFNDTLAEADTEDDWQQQ